MVSVVLVPAKIDGGNCSQPLPPLLVVCWQCLVVLSL